MQNIGDFLKEIRQSRQLKQKDIALAMGFTSSFLSHIEAGRKDIPKDFITKFNDIIPLNPTEFANLTKIIDSQKFSENKTQSIDRIKKELRLIIDKLLLKLSQGINDMDLIKKIKEMIDVVERFMQNNNTNNASLNF